MVAGKGVWEMTATAAIAVLHRMRAFVSWSWNSTQVALAQSVPDLEAMPISAPEALDQYLRDNGFAHKRLSHRVVDMVGTAAPGIDDIVVLGKIKQLERAGQWDLVVVDGPAAGHAITLPDVR